MWRHHRRRRWVNCEAALEREGSSQRVYTFEFVC